MASEEMVEELEKALEDLQLKVSDIQTMYTSTERNQRLEIETLKAEKFEQDVQMERMRQDYIKNIKPDEGGTISGIKAMIPSTLPNQNSMTLERRRSCTRGDTCSQPCYQLTMSSGT